MTAWPLALCLSLLSACGESAPPEPTMPEPIVQGNQLRFPAGHPQLALLGVSAAVPAKSVTVELPAKLVWNESLTQRIYPAFAGRVTAIQADVGQHVKPGSALARLASPDFGVAQADTAKARADLSVAQKAAQRQRELFDAGIVARKDLEQAEADAARAQAEAMRAEARTRLYGGDAGVNQQLALTAGIQGVVVERNINPGQELRPDQAGPGVPALFVVTDPTSLWVQIDAHESDAVALQPGATFELSVPTLAGQTFSGRVVAAADFIDPTTRTIKIRGAVANPQRLLKGEMLGTVRVQRNLGAGVMVPAAAVQLRGTRHVVFVQSQPGVFESREVTLGYEGPKDVVVTQGLAAGDKVVSDNVLLLARQFRVAQEDAKTPAAPAASSAGAARP